MARIEHMSQIAQGSVSAVTAFSQRHAESACARSACKSVIAAFVSRTGDDSFSAKRLKAALLPSVQSCQSGIFSELRHREAARSKDPHA